MSLILIARPWAQQAVFNNLLSLYIKD